MSLTITNQSEIPEYALVRNPLFYKVNSDAYIQTSGSKASNEFTFTSNPSNNDTLTFDIPNIGASIVFTFKTTPDDSGVQLPLGTHTSTTYINTLVTELQKNYILSKYYNAANGGTSKITFTAKENGELYDIDLTSSLGTESATGGNNDVYRKNFAIGCKIFFLDGVDPQFILEVPSVPDDDGDISLNIAPYLLPQLNEPDIPIFNDNQIRILTNHVVSYQLQFFERYGDPPNEFQLQNVYGKVIRGGISLYSQEDIQDIVTDYFAAGRWMSFQGNERYITEDQHIYVNWMNWTDFDQEFNLIVQVFYTDGTDRTITRFTNEVIDIGQIAQIPMGFEQLALELLEPEKTPHHYTCQLLRSSNFTEVAETLTFYIEDNHFNEVFFFYEGSLGTMEVFRAIGEKSYDLKSEKEEIRNILQVDFNSRTRMLQSFNHEMSESVKVSSGGMDKAQLIAFKELLVSQTVLIAKDGKYRSVEIDANNYKLFDDDSGLYAVEFDYRESLINQLPELI